ncbi:bifunctional adenosylcobinamide kinase/adenosylcobinamide-phosphate guanylyltransferase [Agrobacterium sp. ES01]|uniref:bifunctional adenosylcobinamide kinase/adenosylcobinamide-phosphate guanylyltransferase n=1 Tax=Agrobacterium sp. ES01 TaxID=3420714 RepID=UPI003D111BE4
MAADKTRNVTFVLGGARSGKSRFAENIVTDTCLDRHYIATGQAFDDEMRARIAAHRSDRGEGWITHEAPLELVETLTSSSASQNAVLVDCLTLWVSNLMLADKDVEGQSAGLADCLRHLSGEIVIVANEVGLGIVPDNRMARKFRDHAGRLNQMIAAQADTVYFVAAGLPLKMKG